MSSEAYGQTNVEVIYAARTMSKDKENTDQQTTYSKDDNDASTLLRKPLIGTNRNCYHISTTKTQKRQPRLVLKKSNHKQTDPILEIGNEDERVSVDVVNIATHFTLQAPRNEACTYYISSSPTKQKHQQPPSTASLLASKGVGSGALRKIQFVDAQCSRFLKLFLDDYTEEEYWSMLDCLHANEVVVKIVVFCKRQTDGIRTRTREELDCFFYLLHHLACTLQELHLWNLAESRDVPSLTKGITGHISLEYIQLHMESGTIDELLSGALATLPKLISVELEVQASFSVAPILQSRSLMVLGIISSLSHFLFQEDHIVDLIKALEKNSTLAVLDLEPCMSGYCLRAIMHAMRHHASLETFQFSCTADNEKEGESTLEAILDTLRVTNTNKLRVVWNHRYESFSVSDNTKEKALQVLGNNPTVEQFYVFVEDPNFWYKKNAILEQHPSS